MNESEKERLECMRQLRIFLNFSALLATRFSWGTRQEDGRQTQRWPRTIVTALTVLLIFCLSYKVLPSRVNVFRCALLFVCVFHGNWLSF